MFNRKNNMNEFEIYKNFVPTNSVIYDIGAHIGAMSNFFIENGAKHVYAFEPSAYNLPELKNNTNHHSNITVFDVALSNESNVYNTRFKDCRLDGELDREQNIKYVILENFIKENNLDLPNFIKLDIEGMESIVLTTFDFLFTGSRPIIYVEIHAAERGATYQNYRHNPHWRWPQDGGFDFNKLKKFNYKIILNNGTELDFNLDYNPKENSHTSYILLPN
jgi:FkbM family methyltransferase